MRTTLDLGEDVFYAAKSFAKSNKQTMGEVITAWAREKFTNLPSNVTASPSSNTSSNTASIASLDSSADLMSRNQTTMIKHVSAFESLGFRTLPKASGAANVCMPIGNEAINRLREQEGI